jgi:hypothetical protein
VKLRLAAAIAELQKKEPEELRAVAVLATPRCDPDGSEIRREAKAATAAQDLRTENRELRTDPPAWRRNITFDALGWHMAERLQAAKLLAGDTLDIAFCIGHNDHPEYGGLELALRDFRTRA